MVTTISGLTIHTNQVTDFRYLLDVSFILLELHPEDVVSQNI